MNITMDLYFEKNFRKKESILSIWILVHRILHCEETIARTGRMSFSKFKLRDKLPEMIAVDYFTENFRSHGSVHPSKRVCSVLLEWAHLQLYIWKFCLLSQNTFHVLNSKMKIDLFSFKRHGSHVWGENEMYISVPCQDDDASSCCFPRAFLKVDDFY